MCRFSPLSNFTCILMESINFVACKQPVSGFYDAFYCGSGSAAMELKLKLLSVTLSIVWGVFFFFFFSESILLLNKTFLL